MKRKLLSLLAGGVVAFTMNAAAQDVSGPLEKAAAKPTGKPGVTAEQRVLLNEKLALVRQIAAAAGVDRVGESVTAERQRWMLESLYKMPTAKLRAVPLTGSPDVLANEIVRASKANTKLEGPAFGGNATELVYIPLTPCRFIDSRNVGGPLVGTAAFDLDLTGSSYGGSAACDPSAAVGGNANLIGAIAINVAIVSPTAAPGFVGARPFGATTTTALVNWYQAGASVQASNAGVVTTDQSGSAAEIELFGSPTQYIVDIFGLFAAPTSTQLECVQTFVEQTNVAIGALFNFAIPACPTGYALTGAGCRTPSVNGANWAINGLYKITTGDVLAAYCSGRNDTGSIQSIQGTAQCCRIPGR